MHMGEHACVCVRSYIYIYIHERYILVRGRKRRVVWGGVGGSGGVAKKGVREVKNEV